MEGVFHPQHITWENGRIPSCTRGNFPTVPWECPCSSLPWPGPTQLITPGQSPGLPIQHRTWETAGQFRVRWKDNANYRYIHANCIGTEDSLVFLLAEKKFLPILKQRPLLILFSLALEMDLKVTQLYLSIQLMVLLPKYKWCCEVYEVYVDVIYKYMKSTTLLIENVVNNTSIVSGAALDTKASPFYHSGDPSIFNWVQQFLSPLLMTKSFNLSLNCKAM